MNKNKFKEGYIVIINILFFLVISLVVIFGIAGPVIGSYNIGTAFLESKQAFMIANSASEEALYRLKTGMNLPPSETLELASGTATINSGDSGEDKIVSIDSTVGDFERNLQVKVNKGVGVSFNYGLQSGQGGFEMSGGAGINGNVYSNGDIVGTGGPFITGSATAANISSPIANQTNTGPATPAYNLSFGSNIAPQDIAQSFQVSTTTPITSVTLYIKKSSTAYMTNVTLRITADNGSKPHRNSIATGVISADQVTTSYNYLNIPLSAAVTLTPNTTYWIVLDASSTYGQSYINGATLNTYANGVAKTGTFSTSNGGTWSDSSPAGQDMYFSVFVGGDTGKISGVTIGSAGGDAWAHEVSGSNVSGTIYCVAGSGNNKSCNTSRVDPVEQPLPISDGNIQEWKDVASSGTVFVGNKSYQSNDRVSIGPMKIVGNLDIGGGAVVTLVDTVWVTGNISITGGGVLKLGTNYGATSGIIVTDGRISAGGGGNFQGSGTAGSYILAVTTSACPYSGSCGSSRPAIDVTGGSGSVVLSAQNGVLEFGGGASAKQATAKKIVMSGGSTVTYETGLANINFKSGPSGSWNLVSWDEVE